MEGQAVQLPETVPCSESRCHRVTVGVEPSAQEIICIDAGTSKVPAASQSAGCYPGGEYDMKSPVASFSGADGFYFGRTGEELHYKAGTRSMTQVSSMVGC